MYFDTHVHLDGFPAAEVAGIVQRAWDAGVTRLLAVGHAPSANAVALALATQFPGRIRAAVGYDRECATGAYCAAELGALVAACEPAAIGEIGLDFHYHPETAGAQQALFSEMLSLARRHRLPVIVHNREADAATLGLLAAHVAAWPGPPDRVGVLHCFTGDADFARRLTDLGFHISFSGIVTFKQADAIRAAARAVPDDRLLIETDSPYLAPVPHRGQRNEPAYLPQIAAVLAAVRGCSVEGLADLTTGNAERLFSG